MKTHCVIARFYYQLERFFHVKITVTMISTNFVTNYFVFLFIFSKKPQIKIKFLASWRSGNEKYYSFFIIPCSVLLQGFAEFIRAL